MNSFSSKHKLLKLWNVTTKDGVSILNINKQILKNADTVASAQLQNNYFNTILDLSSDWTSLSTITEATTDYYFYSWEINFDLFDLKTASFLQSKILLRVGDSESGLNTIIIPNHSINSENKYWSVQTFALSTKQKITYHTGIRLPDNIINNDVEPGSIQAKLVANLTNPRMYL